MSKVKAIPDGYEGANPYLCCKDAAKAIEFYKAAFGATELYRLPMPDGQVGHAELKIGNAIIMLSDEFPDMKWFSPETVGGSSVCIMIYVPDVDAFAEHATANGAELNRPVADQFYGDRSCKIIDPFGHIWTFATHKEDVSPEEMRRRCDALYGGG